MGRSTSTAKMISTSSEKKGKGKIQSRSNDELSQRQNYLPEQERNAGQISTNSTSHSSVTTKSTKTTASSCVDSHLQDFCRQRSASFGHTAQETSTLRHRINQQMLHNLSNDKFHQKHPSRNSYSSTESLSDQECSPGITTKEECPKFSKEEEKMRTDQASLGLVFDYCHGTIKHRPKTAFGSIIHDEFQRLPDKATLTKETKKKTQKMEPEHVWTEEATDDIEPIRVDDFINQCITDSQTIVIKPSEKTQSSTLFSQIMDEFLPNSTDHSYIPDTMELDKKSRIRANSLPINSKPTSIMKHREKPCGRKVKILSPLARNDM